MPSVQAPPLRHGLFPEKAQTGVVSVNMREEGETETHVREQRENMYDGVKGGMEVVDEGENTAWERVRDTCEAARKVRCGDDNSQQSSYVRAQPLWHETGQASEAVTPAASVT
eukprot:COSAG02_NODE_18_length_54986_cov_345.599322_47_plen_113_part_00